MSDLKWKKYTGGKVNGIKVQADLSCAGDFVISHRHEQFTVSYRPTGHHIHVGTFTTLAAAKRAAEAFTLPSLAKCKAHGCTALHS